jgi:flagellar biogenesis protein FliO
VAALLVLLKTVMVFGLLGVTLYVLRRTNGLKARSSLLEVRGSTRLGKGATLTAVRIDGRDLLLGVTDHTVTLLTSEEATDEVTPNEAADPRPSLLTALRAGRTPVEERPSFGTALRAGLPGFLRPDSKQLSEEEIASTLAQLLQAPPLAATDGPVAPRSSDARREELACADQSVA